MDWNVDMGGCSTNQHQATTPLLCAGGCGFFGTAENRGLCSKCYNDDRLKEIIAKIQAATPPPSDDFKIEDVAKENEVGASLANSATDAITPSAEKSRCNVCRRKLGLLWYVCRCGVGFCSSHRHPEAHGCTFDFKEAGKIAIEEENPICKADKMTRRI